MVKYSRSRNVRRNSKRRNSKSNRRRTITKKSRRANRRRTYRRRTYRRRTYRRRNLKGGSAFDANDMFGDLSPEPEAEPEAEAPMNVRVSGDGTVPAITQALEYEVDTRVKVGELRKIIESIIRKHPSEKERRMRGFGPRLIHFWFNGKELWDDMTLADAGVGEGAKAREAADAELQAANDATAAAEKQRRDAAAAIAAAAKGLEKATKAQYNADIKITYKDGPPSPPPVFIPTNTSVENVVRLQTENASLRTDLHKCNRDYRNYSSYAPPAGRH